MLRLARSDEVLLGYWLPLPQVVVYLARAVAPDPVWTRLAFAAVGAAAAVALARLVAAVSGAAAGRCAGVLLALHPMWVYYSIVPYQEALLLLFLALGATELARGRDARAAAWLGLAGLCRYEAWIAAGLAAAARWRRPLRALALFGTAPAAWLLFRGGLNPPGTYVLDLDPAAPRLSRLVFVLAKLREYSGDAVLVAAAAGALLALRRRDRRWAWGAAFLLLLLAATAVAGHEFPPGSGRVSERMAHLPAAAACALAGLALGALVDARGWRWPAARAAAAAAFVAAVAWPWTGRTRAQVEEANRDPSLRLAVQVAALADRYLPAGGTLAVAAPAPTSAEMEGFLRKLAAAGAGPAEARAAAEQWARHSPDAARVAAHLPRPPRSVRAEAADGPGRPAPAADLRVLFHERDGGPTCAHVMGRFEADGRAATVCRQEAAAVR